MDKPLVAIIYKLANGKRISLEVSPPVKSLLEQADRQIRSQRRRDRRHLDFVGYIESLPDTAMIDPQEETADLVIKMESCERLYSAIEKLSEIQRRRLYLRYVYELTYRQIAELEGVNLSAVGNSIVRATQRLKKLLAD